MFKSILVLLALATTTFSAEISSSYAMLEKQAVFKPDLKTEPVGTHAMQKEDLEVEHPVYTTEDRNQGRARIEPVRSFGPVIKHDRMLSDQPADAAEVSRNGEVGILENGYIPGTANVAYPDIPYAPGYLYDTGYSNSNNYDMYGSNTYLMEPDMSPMGLLWSQVPHARTLVGFVGRTIAWFFNSIFVLFIGSLLTVGVCTYTNLCTIAFHGVGPIHEEMRALVTPERLEKIGHAAEFVKTAIDKYQNIQKVSDAAGMRRRRAIFNY
ncbi:hypothetical protein PYW07_016628 [Mythimna separata]|uniref:Uncharacterized protein n=1 Tax=Mythimna separata TaxID=271217 RepID=A0AAD8DS04_MYTSE|nr:hypothetical protein PYW07_016628 [Mythimna separata]